jgi:ectoine hydroxylase-related dioxygenase (phytanoyl-CoA dioxygenase family)
MSPSPHFVESFRRQSFVVLPQFLESNDQIVLRRACDVALEWSRAHCAETSHTTPRISLLTQGGSFEDGPALLAPVLAFASSARVCTLLASLASSDLSRMPQLKDVHYYHEQTQHDWDGDWHRDSQFSRADLGLERELIESSWSVHVRVAFEADDRLEVVPASHLRWDTAEELRVRRGSQRASAAMPNAVRVSLRPGDACLFHAWSIHRATYRRAPIRRTLDLLYAETSRPK